MANSRRSRRLLSLHQGIVVSKRLFDRATFAFWGRALSTPWLSTSAFRGSSRRGQALLRPQVADATGRGAKASIAFGQIIDHRLLPPHELKLLQPRRPGALCKCRWFARAAPSVYPFSHLSWQVEQAGESSASQSRGKLLEAAMSAGREPSMIATDENGALAPEPERPPPMPSGHDYARIAAAHKTPRLPALATFVLGHTDRALA